VQFKRCGTCTACKHIERVKPTILRCANPPFSHATDDTVKVWNQTLFDNPCEQWTGEQKLASRAQMLTLNEPIRPMPDKLKLRLIVEVIYDLNGTSVEQLKGFMEDLSKIVFGHGGFTGDTPAEVDSHSVTVEKIDPAIDCAVSIANLLQIDTQDLDDLVHDVASSPASEINNQGLDDQVRFLCEQLGAKQVIDKLYEMRAAEGENDVG
jgi:hypothetical protein